jgi:hypothetical protein
MDPRRGGRGRRQRHQRARSPGGRVDGKVPLQQRDDIVIERGVQARLREHAAAFRSRTSTSESIEGLASSAASMARRPRIPVTAVAPPSRSTMGPSDGA